MDANAQTEPVEHGHDRKHAVAGRQTIAHGEGLHRQGIEVQIGQQNAFGSSRGAARIEDSGRVFPFGIGGKGAEVGICHGKKIIPPNDVGIFGNFIDFPPLGKIIPYPQGKIQGVFHPGDNQLGQMHLGTSGLKFCVKLIHTNGGD